MAPAAALEMQQMGSANTGSLPDLSSLQFCSPLKTPLDPPTDPDDSVGNLRPSGALRSRAVRQSLQRRHTHSGPSPLVGQPRHNMQQLNAVSGEPVKQEKYNQQYAHYQLPRQMPPMMYRQIQQQQQSPTTQQPVEFTLQYSGNNPVNSISPSTTMQSMGSTRPSMSASNNNYYQQRQQQVVFTNSMQSQLEPGGYNNSVGNNLSQQQRTASNPNLSNGYNMMPRSNVARDTGSHIPNIILTGEIDANQNSNYLSNEMDKEDDVLVSDANMGTDLFNFHDLDSIDYANLQLLDNPEFIADSAAEAVFRSDRLG
ncbi:uncharacterized protein TRIADDRAFT_54115 [Trichoplax adhaerens]|uniref:Transducer of regulated CREB activity C-terminal domain-containing protein n=1 Tax=Trichoplax adhaerens TaxID=10228 RepID=B3RR55_TRIAD|nr:predicted protein [Trichoplax adhaerens]EDV26284.1 predicted protein [Trichoplax adhaerens]|eukprot:XP_002110280.1 predicted protein [Trichoplax adhaerens]